MPIHSKELGDSLIDNVMSKFCVSDYIIKEQDRIFESSLINCLLKKFSKAAKTVALYNHQSLQAEHGIKSLFIIMTKHLV